MKPSKMFAAVRNRWFTVMRYAAAAPGMMALPRWLYLGALRSRLLGGDGRYGSSDDGQPCDFCVPIGRDQGEQVIVDTTSFAELDVLQEVLVDRIYPLGCIGFVPAMILDCGANIGYFACLCRLHFPNAEINCWEPDAHNFSRLINQPMLQSEVVHCFEAAVSNAEGEASITGSGTGCKVDSATGNGDQRIKTVDLRQWIKQNGKVPLLIKMDIEGHEVEVVDALHGVWKRPCVIFLETHAEQGRDEHVLTQLRMAGFDLMLLRRHELPKDSRIFKEYMGKLGIESA